MKKKLKAIIAMATLATIAFSAPISSLANNKEAKKDAMLEAKAAAAKQKRSIGYYADWSIYSGEGFAFPKQVPAKYLTHVNVAFTGCNKDGTLLMLDPDANFGHPLGHTEVDYGAASGGVVNELKNIRQQNPNVKLGFSIGGWSLSGNFTHVARDEAKRKVFAKEIAEVLEYTNFDFIDIDWEYPASPRQPDNEDLKNDQGNPDAIPEDKENYVLMLQEIRNELDKLGEQTGKYYEISIAINMSHEKTEIGIDVPKIFNIIDFANVMTYDAAGAWDSRSGHQTALYDNPDPNNAYAGKGFSIDTSIKNFLKKGAPPNKLVVGAAYYTRGWEKVSSEGTNPNTPGLFGKATQVLKDIDLAPTYGAKNDKPIVRGDGGRYAGNWAWRNRDKLLQTYPGLKEYWDDTAKAPYLYAEDGAFFTYDNKRSIAEKCKYVNANQLGGIITWMVTNDKVTESGQNDDLTKAIYEGLYGNTQLPKYPIAEEKVDVTAKVSVTNQDWGATPAVLNIDITNNMKLTSAGSLMPKTAENSYKTLKFPKVYIKAKPGFKLSGGSYPLYNIPYENGYYILDIGGTQEKYIVPGKTLQLTVNLDKSAGKPSDVIEEMYMVQRTHRSAVEFGKINLFDGVIKEDINKDGVVDIVDLSLVSTKYNLKSTDSLYDAKCDVNSDKIIDIFDIVQVARKIGGGDTPGPDEPLEGPWKVGVAYKVGDKVSFSGSNYTCTYAHTSIEGWEPTKAPTLWKKS
ncbi:MAG: glycosyl hydrolase family 18 protein [Clostridium sp.]